MYVPFLIPSVTVYISSNIFKGKRKTLPLNPAVPFTSLNPREMRKRPHDDTHVDRQAALFAMAPEEMTYIFMTGEWTDTRGLARQRDATQQG